MTDDVANDVTTPSEVSVTSSRSSLKLPSNGPSNPLSRSGSYREKLPKLSPKLQKNFLGNDLPNNEDLNDSSSSSDSGCPHPVVNGNQVNGVVGVNGDAKVDEEKNDIVSFCVCFINVALYFFNCMCIFTFNDSFQLIFNLTSLIDI